MKKHLIICMLLVVAGANIKAQDKGIRWGLYDCLQGNGSAFSGGDLVANGRFSKHAHMGLSLGLRWRYDLNDKFMFTTGIGLQNWGFEFEVKEDYMLRRDRMQPYAFMDFLSAEIPLMAWYKSRPDCRGIRWIAGLGIGVQLTGKQTVRSRMDVDDGQSSMTVLNSTARARNGAGASLRFAYGIERELKNGRIIQFALEFNKGLQARGHAAVSYIAEGKSYYHEFVNRGNYIGVSTTVFFRKRGSRPAPAN